jgi:divalent metal cation (Fe/Co/Zn/Cd) transporter
VFVGISLALVLGEGYESMDDWAALVACGVIGVNGARLFHSALADVLDEAAPSDVEERIRDIAGSVPEVRGVDLCRVRRSGLAYFVDLHVEVLGDLSVRRGHEIAHEVKDVLMVSELPVLDVLVHVEPR